MMLAYLTLRAELERDARSGTGGHRHHHAQARRQTDALEAEVARWRAENGR